MAQNASSDMKNLYCVEYPGKVQNIDRAIATLGGIHTISNVGNRFSLSLDIRMVFNLFLSITGVRKQPT